MILRGPNKGEALTCKNLFLKALYLPEKTPILTHLGWDSKLGKYQTDRYKYSEGNNLSSDSWSMLLVAKHVKK